MSKGPPAQERRKVTQIDHPILHTQPTKPTNKHVFAALTSDDAHCIHCPPILMMGALQMGCPRWWRGLPETGILTDHW